MFVYRKVGPKGQVVVPEGIRKVLGINPGTEVEFDLRGNEAILRRSNARKNVEDFFNDLPKKKGLKIDLDAAYEEEMEERHGALLRR